MTPRDDGEEPLAILVVDDETIVRESLGSWFRDDGYHVDTADSAREALRLAADRHYDVAFVDIKMPRTDGLELQTRLAQAAPDLEIVVMTAYASVETAVRALKAGAYDYIIKPFDPDDLSHLVRRIADHRSLHAENLRLKRTLDASGFEEPIVGSSPATKRILELIANVAPSDATVLVQGESGTGKELVARAIHALSPRRYSPLVTVHCGALAAGVLESELFGHEKGSFTGAEFAHKGKFEQADGGTIFLDEIGEVSPHVQVELLRVLEEKRVTRVGGDTAVPVDFRVVAATNRDLREMVARGVFREDLYYRMNVVTIEVPPLRERRQEIRELAEHFLGKFARSMNRRGLRFTDAALAALEAHDWPGNARELQNAVERAVVLGTPPVVEAHDLPQYVAHSTPSTTSKALRDVERAHIARVLDDEGWNVSRAASLLGIDRGTLYAKIRKYGLERPAHAG
jgi:DNA-binding NtrC family response regulator